MNKSYSIAVSVICFFALVSGNASAQAFRKGTLLVSVSEGSTFAKYSTTNTNATTDVLHQDYIHGDRDPLTVEYGISDHVGLGLNMGTDVFKVNPATFYGFQTSDHIVKALMSEITVDGNYHFFVTKKLDVAAFTSIGVSSISFTGNDGDRHYNYEAGGFIARTGIKAKYYFFKGLGVMGMLSAFSDNCSTEGHKGNTVGDGYNTSIKGAALEFGLCYCIFR